LVTLPDKLLQTVVTSLNEWKTTPSFFSHLIQFKLICCCCCCCYP
jgi:hypothetical protein